VTDAVSVPVEEDIVTCPYINTQNGSGIAAPDSMSQSIVKSC